MGKLIQSYVHGVSALPLIGDTIGVHFDRAVARWPESEALVVRHQGVRWTYRELSRPKRARRYTECRLCSLPYGLAPKVSFFTAAPSDVRRGLPRRRSDKRHPAMPVVRPLAQKRRAQPGPGAKPHRLVRTAGEAKPRRTSGGGAASKSFGAKPQLYFVPPARKPPA